MKKFSRLLMISLLHGTMSYANELSATIYATEKNKAPLGKITFTDTQYGLLIKPDLTTLPAGAHGFHLHQHANCGDAGMDAGGHFDPKDTKKHLGPYGDGHLGDLPVLFIMEDGKANTPLLAPRLKTSDLTGLAVMIHAGGDNYSDNPALGGGGARLGCGVFNSSSEKNTPAE
ncbi:superoxide dismutase family protein [Legionella gresilensis]|uniref:superoxide dismutase family protein n=1 Tax=Legionella gresilensis TaxID=91823 RepID=UPI0010418405|nr:superoxide dismutase family protein [Legionella gresilensis]